MPSLSALEKRLAARPEEPDSANAQADIFLCAPCRYCVLDAVDVDSVDAAAQPLLHCLECGVAVLCCLLAVLGVITDAHDDLRTLSVYRHTRVLRCQQVLQCSFHLSGV